MLLSFQKETMHAEASLKACQQFKAKVAFQELCLLFGLTLLIHHGGSNEKANTVQPELQNSPQES